MYFQQRFTGYNFTCYTTGRLMYCKKKKKKKGTMQVILPTTLRKASSVTCHSVLLLYSRTQPQGFMSPHRNVLTNLQRGRPFTQNTYPVIYSMTSRSNKFPEDTHYNKNYD